jgi:hypothetical protein
LHPHRFRLVGGRPVRVIRPTLGIVIMRIAHFIVGVAALFGFTAAQADGFAITRPLSNGRELHLLEHASPCNGGPGAFIYRRGQLLDQTCDVRLTAAGATVVLPPFEPRMFFPRDTLYPN